MSFLLVLTLTQTMVSQESPMSLAESRDRPGLTKASQRLSPRQIWGPPSSLRDTPSPLLDTQQKSMLSGPGGPAGQVHLEALDLFLV